jgi:hypothetical protein
VGAKHGKGDPCVSERIYDDDEAEFLRAVERYRDRTGRRFPTLSELLAVLKGLGYRKPQADREQI